MADRSAIEWTDASWNPIVGCSVVSPGCTNCYAMRQAARIERMQPGSHYAGTVQPSKAGPVWTGKVALAPEHLLTQPLRWRQPRRIFVNSMGDLFHESVPEEWIDRVFAVMALTPQHTFQVLTKRSARMRAYLNADQLRERWAGRGEIALGIATTAAGSFGNAGRIIEAGSPLPNVWLGVSTEDQRRWDERTADLKATPAAVRFVSAEPLLGGIAGDMEGIHLVIVGGESGPNARPMHPDWARSLRDQCAAASTAFFFKQWGEWGFAAPRPSGTPGKYAIATAGPHSEFWPQMVIPVDQYPRQIDLFGGAKVLEGLGKHAAGRLLDGVEHNAMPEVR